MTVEPDARVRSGRVGPHPDSSVRAADGTRERLLHAAASLLAERGYGQTRLGDVAALAGLRPPAIYYYFDSRDELISEVMRVGQQRVRSHVEDAVRCAPGGAMDRIEAAVAAHLEIQLELSDFAAAVIRNAGHVPRRVRVALEEESDAYHETWRDLITAACASGELRSDLDPTIARMLVIGALNWAVEWWTKGPSIAELIFTSQQLVRRALAT